MDYENVLSVLREIKTRLKVLSAQADQREVSRKEKTKAESEVVNNFSRVKVVSPKQEDMQKSENMSMKDLDRFTADSIAARYRKKWCKLDTVMKRDRLAFFAKSLEGSSEAEVFLFINYFETKKIRPKDIDYDEIRGKINSIPALVIEAGDFKIVRPKPVKEATEPKLMAEKPAKLKPTVSTLTKKLNARRA